MSTSNSSATLDPATRAGIAIGATLFILVMLAIAAIIITVAWFFERRSRKEQTWSCLWIWRKSLRRSTVENLPATTGDHSYVNVMSINDLNAISKHASKQQSEDVLYQSIHVELPPSSREAPGSSDCDRLNVQPYAVTDIHPEAAKEYLVVPTAEARKSNGNKAWLPSSKGAFSLLADLLTRPQEVVHYEMMAKEPFLTPPNRKDELYNHLAKYSILEIPIHSLRKEFQIGCGQFGQVIKGKWITPLMTKDVAIKCVLPDGDISEEVSLLKEGATVAQFRHKHIVLLFGAVTKDAPILVFEYLSCGDLKNYLQRQRESIMQALPQALLRFCREISDGMNYLSQKRFVHADLAARNILLDDTLTCKIADFGLSHKLQSEEYYTSSNSMIPIKWTAPEALLYKRYSPASDVWSYGMLMFEIWSLGEKPFPSLTINEVVLKLKGTSYIQPPPPGCPREVFRLMVMCWNYSSYDRPTFDDIYTCLSKEDSFLLALSEIHFKDLKDPQGAQCLGYRLDAAYDLYIDLQRFYM